MSSCWKYLFTLCMSAACCLAQPTVGGVVNSASSAQAPLDANGASIGKNVIAQGAIIVIFGKNLGPANLVVPPGLPLPTSIPDANGTSVSISAGGQTLPAYMVYSLATQVAAIVPSTTPVGPATVSVKYNGQTSNGFPVTVAKTGLGVFTRNSQGNGPAIAQIARSATDVTVNTLTNSAQAGDTMIIYGTGLGAIAGPDNVAPGAIAAGTNVTVNIAGTVIPSQYAGRSPNFPGLDQINFQLPANIATGCYIPAEITASGQPSNLFYLSIGSGSTTCVHPLGLSKDTLAALDAGGTANVGHFLALTAVVLGVPAEGAGGVFDTVNADGAFQLTNRILFAFGGANYPVASGACAVLDTFDPGASFSVPNLSQVGGTELRAGPGLTITGPGNSSQGILPADTGGYLAVFFSTLKAGSWTLSGTGGPDVGAFNATTTLPENLKWTNVGNFSNIPRSDINITWTGGSVNAQSLVTVFGSSTVINPNDPSKSRGKQFYCNGPASAGKLVVPASVIAQMPSSAVDTAAGEVAFGTLGINAGGGSTFTAPLTKGKLDAGYFAYGEAQTIPVKY